MTPTRAYSYVRFSTPEQMKGDSLRRQEAMAERYANEHGLILDDSLTFQDLGRSAFRGRNLEEGGHLREFLTFVESGDVPVGSYLLVESLDRLSRNKARKAVRLLEDICGMGITVVTLADGKRYTEEALNDDPMAMMWALMVAMRANEESEIKAKRVGAAWSNKRDRARREGKPMTERCPGWLRLREDRSGYDLIPDRADVVRQIFGWTLEGRGQHWIAAELNRQRIEVFGRGERWHRSYIAKMLHDRSTIGEYQPNRMVAGGRREAAGEAVEGYFPAVVDPETFERVDEVRRERADSVKPRNTATLRGPATHMLAGLAKCPLCGATMTRVNKGKRSRPTLVCVTAKSKGACIYKAVPVEHLHDAIRGVNMAYMLTEGMPAGDDRLQEEFDRLGAELGGIEDGIDRITDAIQEGKPHAPLMVRLEELEAVKSATRAALERVGGEITAQLTNRLQQAVGRLLDAIEADDMLEANKELRGVFFRAVVDWETGRLRWVWRHAPEVETELMYAWPETANI